jgi:hypothetical protein
MTASRALVLALLFASAAVAAPVPKALKAATDVNLDGKWEVVELWSGMSDVAKLNPWVWEIKGESLTVFIQEKGTLKLYDPNMKTTLTRPADGGADAIDYLRDDGKSPMTFKGTAVIENEQLILCFDGPGKPRRVERAPFQSGWYYKFKRVQEK